VRNQLLKKQIFKVRIKQMKTKQVRIKCGGCMTTQFLTTQFLTTKAFPSLVTLIMGLTTSVLVSSCGQSQVSLKSSPSLNPPSPTTPNPLLSEEPALGRCSVDMSQDPEFGIKLKTYEGLNQNPSVELIQIQFLRIPSVFGQSDDHALQLWTRTVTSAGQWGSWQNLRFFILYSASGQTRVTPHSYKDLTWKDLKAIASSFGVPVQNPSQFFHQFHLLAEMDARGDGKIITPTLYAGSQKTDISHHITALAPVFDANPNRYQLTHPQVLMALHPLKSFLGYGFTKSQYEFEINRFCF
jgi:hypothetical protein